MRCNFCPDQECYMPDDLPRSPKIDLYQCRNCKAYYRTLADWEDALLSISWKFKINDKEYAIKSYDGCTGNAPEFVVYFHFQNDRNEWDWKEIKRFDFIPRDWTPLNSTQKLQLYLPFL